jgi:hypothetical protein
MKRTDVFGGYLKVGSYWRVFGFPIQIFDHDRGVTKESQLIKYILRKFANNFVITARTPLFGHESIPSDLLCSIKPEKWIKDEGMNGRKEEGAKGLKVNNTSLIAAKLFPECWEVIYTTLSYLPKCWKVIHTAINYLQEYWKVIRTTKNYFPELWKASRTTTNYFPELWKASRTATNHFPELWKVSYTATNHFPELWKISRTATNHFPELWKISRIATNIFPELWKISRTTMSFFPEYGNLFRMVARKNMYNIRQDYMPAKEIYNKITIDKYIKNTQNL